MHVDISLIIATSANSVAETLLCSFISWRYQTSANILTLVILGIEQRQDILSMRSVNMLLQHADPQCIQGLALLVVNHRQKYAVEVGFHFLGTKETCTKTRCFCGCMQIHII